MLRGCVETRLSLTPGLPFSAAPPAARPDRNKDKDIPGPFLLMCQGPPTPRPLVLC